MNQMIEPPATVISRTISGNPVSQKRHRHRNAGKFVQTYDPSKTDKKNFLEAVLEQGPLTELQGPLSMACVFTFQRPKSHLLKSGNLTKAAPREMTTKPDLDNLVKLVKDALNGHAYHDDSQIITLTAAKEYGEPSTQFTIIKLSDQTQLI